MGVGLFASISTTTATTTKTAKTASSSSRSSRRSERDTPSTSSTGQHAKQPIHSRRTTRTSLPTFAFLLATVATTQVSHAAENDDSNAASVTYATIEVASEGRGAIAPEALSITAVYASYSSTAPVANAELVAAEPFDGCKKMKRPKFLSKGQPFAFLARLNANSTCTAVEQSMNAWQAGASAIVNMAPEAQSNYIWILQQTRSDITNQRRIAPVPQVAVSGLSGGKIHQAILRDTAVLVSIHQQGDDEVDELAAVDLAVTIVCVTVALLVLLYAFRVGRSIFTLPDQYEQAVDPERQAQLRARVSQILADDLPVVKYTTTGSDANTENRDCCAVCLEELEVGAEVRKLSCDHVFHVACIDPWLLDHQNCPLCKDNIISPRKYSSGLEGEAAEQDLLLANGEFLLSIPAEAYETTSTPDAGEFIIGSESGEWQDELRTGDLVASSQTYPTPTAQQTCSESCSEETAISIPVVSTPAETKNYTNGHGARTIDYPAMLLHEYGEIGLANPFEVATAARSSPRQGRRANNIGTSSRDVIRSPV